MAYFTTIPSISENATFCSVGWHKLQELAQNPHRGRAQSAAAAKKSSPLVAAHSGKTRSKAEAETSLFGLLRADLDDAKGQTPETLADALHEQGLGSFIIYSTLSHQPDDPRYRVLVELAEPVPFTTWADLQFAFADLLDSDPCVSRPAQFMILPTTIKSTAEHYHYLIGNDEALATSSAFWLNAMEQAAQHQAAAAEVGQKFKQAAPKPFTEKLVGKQVSIIDLVNRAYEWPELLGSYGYLRKGRNAWIAPESTSGMAGAHILTSSTDGKERIFSHHQSDPAGNRLCDKFDLIAIRQFGGNHAQALAEIAKAHFPDAHAHNRREWAMAKRNEQIASVGSATSMTKPMTEPVPIYLSANPAEVAAFLPCGDTQEVTR